ncbi:MAG TPA: phage tail protein [Gammaproteobacteria bacterium]
MANQLIPIITNAGREALMAGFSKAENYRFSQVALGDGGGGGYAPDTGAEGLKNEIQRVDVAGVVIQDHARLHITAVVGNPENKDAKEYNIHEIGFFLQGIGKDGRDTGEAILFAIYATEPGDKPLLAKDPATELLLAFDLVLPDIVEGELKFDKDSYLQLPQATETAPGMVKLANKDETVAGESADKAVTPATLKAALAGFKPSEGGGKVDTDNLVVGNALSVGAKEAGNFKLVVGLSKDDFNDVFFAQPGGGQLESRAWGQGWNFQTMTDGKHLFINRDSGEKSNVLVGRSGKELFVRGADGAVGLGTADPKAKLDIEGNVRITKNEEIFFADNGQIRSLDNNHRLLFRRSENTMELREYGKIVLSAGATKGQETASVVVQPNGDLQVAGKITARAIDAGGAFNPNHHRMYPVDALIYDNIFDAVKKGAIGKMGNPTYDDQSWNPKKPWNGKPLIKFGADNEADGNGAQIVVPDGYNTVWVRVLGDRWSVAKVYYPDGKKEDLGLWAGGYRAGNCYCPDGSLADGQFIGGDDTVLAHQWLPIPVPRSGPVALVVKPKTTNHFWLSGVAFSRNPWGHAAHSAVAYHWQLNGGSDVGWNSHKWNNDVLAQILKGKETALVVPVVSNGNDKLLYLVEHNNNWNGCMHNGIKVNGKEIERFIATYDNPFARHWNSKIYNRYIAARVPAGLIGKDDRWLKVEIDMRGAGNEIYFREIGTHDLVTPAA